MATGYTAPVQSGEVTDLRTFALRCARSMGACIMQRDDPMDQPPAFQKPSDYNARCLEEIRAELAAVRKWTADDANAAADADYAERHAAWEGRQSDRLAQLARYGAMASQVHTWTPPTPDHEGFRTFMEKQIAESIRVDCGYTESPPIPLDGPSFRQSELERLAASVAYHHRAHAEELARVASRNAWIRALYDSLPAAQEDGK